MSMRIALAILMLPLFAWNVLQAQKGERIWLDNKLELCKKAKATHYVIVEPGNYRYTIQLYDKTGQHRMTGQSLDAQATTWDGDFTFYHPNASVESTGKYINGKKAGIWERFDAQGNPRAERTYAPFDAQRMAYTYVDEMPQFKDGQDFFLDFVKHKVESYVSDFQKEPTERPIELGFIIDEDGRIEQLELLAEQDADWHETLEKELQAMPAWQPGRNQGERVRVWMRTPLTITQ